MIDATATAVVMSDSFFSLWVCLCGQADMPLLAASPCYRSVRSVESNHLLLDLK
jgi:hypothetical protein